MVISAYLGDHFHVRGPILIGNALIALIGLPIMGFASTPAYVLIPIPPSPCFAPPSSTQRKSHRPISCILTVYRARYFGVFLLTAGANANIPTSLAYQANNVRGQWKRALCSAMFVACGGIGGIAGATIFRTQDKPRYIPGITAGIV